MSHAVRLQPDDLKVLDWMVEQGYYDSHSAAIRSAIRHPEVYEIGLRKYQEMNE